MDMKNKIVKFFRWLFQLEPVTNVEDAFVGTTAELLSSFQAETMHLSSNPEVEAPVYWVPDAPEEDLWLNQECIKLALEMEKAASVSKVFYVDVGSLPKAKAEQHMTDIMARTQGNFGDLWLPRRDGGRTEVQSVQGSVSILKVLETAEMIKKFRK